MVNVLKCTLKIHYSRKRGRGEGGKGDTEWRQALEWGFPTTVKNLLKEKRLLASELLLAGLWEVVKPQRRLHHFQAEVAGSLSFHVTQKLQRAT